MGIFGTVRRSLWWDCDWRRYTDPADGDKEWICLPTSAARAAFFDLAAGGGRQDYGRCVWIAPPPGHQSKQSKPQSRPNDSPLQPGDL